MRRFLTAAIILSSLSGCAIYEDIMQQDGGASDQRLTAEDTSRITELYIATGRYGVMLSQARDILRLPESVAAGDAAVPAAGDPLQELRGIADQQVRVARELASDTAAACGRAGLPEGVRAVACETARGVPASLQQPVPAQVAAVAARDQELGGLVMRWWDKACSVAPKPSAGEPHACSIE